MSAPAAIVGRVCPYCRFPLKAEAGAAECPECHAVHHADCFDENGGCAIAGCRGKAADEAEPPSATPVSAPPAPAVARTLMQTAPAGELAPGRRRSFPLFLIAAALIVALAGAGAAVVVALRRQSTTRRVVVASAHPRHGGSPTPAAPRAPYHGDRYGISPPAGWQLVEREADHGSYVESKWQLPGDPSVSFLIDHTAGYRGTARSGAASVRAMTLDGEGYREVSWGPVSLPSSEGWAWEYDLAGARKIDIFSTGCRTGYATLGAAPPESFSTYRHVFVGAARSLRPEC